MRFYAACLASYNNGVLHGRWIDATADVDGMQEEVSAMLRESRFPNVRVTCPECEGYGDDKSPTCHTCHGAGSVPSAEEWAIHDTEGLPSRHVGEYSGLAPIAAFVELSEEYDHIDADDLAAIVADFTDIDEASDALSDGFCGVYASFRDYSDEYVDENIMGGKVNETLARYFDYAAFARDLQMDMNTISVSTGIAIFHA